MSISEHENTPTPAENEPMEENQTTEERVTEESAKYDVIVIGSGPGGYTSAVRCAQQGKTVAIVERDLLGGHAVNWGCIPLNAMIASARLLRSIHESSRYGINISSCRIDFSRIARHRDEAVKNARSQIRRFLEKFNIRVYTGDADLVDANEILIRPVQKHYYSDLHDANGRSPYDAEDYESITTEITISGENIIIASGVQYELPAFVTTDDEQTLDPTQLLWHQSIPASLIIIGGGVLGCEFASLYRYLRSNVVLIEKNSRLLKFMDEQVSNAVEKHLKHIGVEIILNAKIVRVSNGEVTMKLNETNEIKSIKANLVVVCTGRKPTINYESLEKLGIVLNNDKFTITIDEKTCRTSISNIFACGGVVSSCWSWVPCAVRQGHSAANAICNESIEDERTHSMVSTFVVNVIPAVASVGEVPKSKDDFLVYTFDFHYNRRAIIDHQTWGFIKMWTTREEPKRFFAVQLVHEAAAELIEYYGMIISLKIPLRDICLLQFAHPTYAESVKQACEYVLGHSMIYEGVYLN